jgi:hypothetical protein
LFCSAIARLSTNLDPCNCDLSNMGPREVVVGEMAHGDSGEEEEEEEIELDQMLPVNSMSLVLFRRKLINHFLIMFTRNLIKWSQNRRKKGIKKGHLFN